MLKALLLGMSRGTGVVGAGGEGEGAAGPAGGSGGGKGGEGEGAPLVPRAFGLDTLAHLARVPRFDMACMCVPARERAELGGLWDAAVGVGGEGGDVAALRKKFRL